jgi:uncharacterized membrane protein
VRWLREELPRLVAGGVLTEESAGRLRAHYGDGEESTGARVVVVLFGILGAVLIGGGIILLLAHNWDELSRPLRTVLSITPLAASLGLAGWVIATKRGAGWREPIAALWTLSIGAAISLVSQTYNLPGDWTSLLTAWLLLAAPIPYLLRSATAAMLFCLGALNWVFARSFGPEDATWFWAFLLLLAPFLVLRFRRDSEDGGPLLGWTIALTVALGLLPSLELLSRGWWEPILVTGAVALWAAGELAVPQRWSRAFRLVGGFGTLGTLLILSFEEVWTDLPEVRDGATPSELAAEWLVVGLVVAAAALLVVAARRHGPAAWTIGAALPIVWVAQWLAGIVTPEWPAVLVNLYLIAFGVALLIAGVRETSLGRANLGAAVLSLLTLFRFFDTEWSFLVRGTAFIAVGVGFVLVNVLLLRRRRRAA